MLHSHIDPFFYMCWIESRFYLLKSLFEDGSCKDGGWGGSVSSLIVGFIGNAFDKAGSNIDRFIREVDSFGDSDTIFSDFRWSITLINKNISSSRA